MSGWLERNFDRVYVLFLFFVSVGAVMDGNDHAHGGIETIFTPGHAMAYGFIGAIALLFGVLLYSRYRDGMSLGEAIPDGYQLTVYSLPLFFLGGLGDMVWHVFFGFETKVTEIVSPTHLAILTFGTLIASGPLRRAWYTGVEKSWRSQFKMLSSSAFLLGILGYLMLVLNPIVNPYAASWHPGAMETLATHLGISGLLVFSIVLTGFTLLMIERFELVPGAFTYVFTLKAVLITYVSEQFLMVLVALGTGVVADLLYRRLDPGTHRLRNFRLFAFLVPMSFAILYYGVIASWGEIVWNVHEWAGTIVFAGLAGLLVSHVVYPSVRELSRGVETGTGD